MTTIEKAFQREIEIERLRTATTQGPFVFFSLMPVSILLIFLLWEDASHFLLLTWLAVLTAINFFRWASMHFYQDTFLKNLSLFKLVLVIGSTSSGVWWAIAVFWFLEPTQALNVMILNLYVSIISMGGILAWYCYLPAVLGILLPPIGTFALLLFLEGSNTNVAMSLIFPILAIAGAVASRKMAHMLNHTLELNFENVALRRKSEEKSLMLETALENMAQGISMSDKNDQLRMWNQPFTDLLGSASETVVPNVNLVSLLKAATPPISTWA